MKKGFYASTLVIIFLISGITYGNSDFLSLKISGGLSRIKDGGDLKKWFNGEKSYFDWLGTQQNYWTKSNYPFKEEEPEGNLEIILRPIHYIGVGVGIGYMRRSWDSSAEVAYNYGGALGSEKIEVSTKNSMDVYPLTLSLIFSVPYKFFKANVFAGGGFYIANVKFNMESKYSWPKFPDRENYIHHYTSNLNTRNEGFGFHGGVGIEIKIISHLSFSVDAILRSVRLGDIKGDMKWREIVEWNGYKSETSGDEKNQTLWIGSFKVGGNQFERAVFSEEKPSFFENARSFHYNLNGVYIKAGILLSF